ncbi:MAG: hypothetical protein PUP91_13720 [Rhizonema sp. PD37]|nr:hypothetical protein [Rhizonema sp. PD37]
MKINLIPVCDSGISYGGDVTNDAINRFRQYLLGVVIVCPEEEFEYSEEFAAPSNITKANFSAVITLFREPKTIGQITAFIHLDGMNINLTGTGGAYGQKFLDCLARNEVQPWFYPLKDAYANIEKNVGNSQFYKDEDISLYKKLQIWEKFLINIVLPNLYTESVGLLGLSRKTGSWLESWRAEDI